MWGCVAPGRITLTTSLPRRADPRRRPIGSRRGTITVR